MKALLVGDMHVRPEDLEECYRLMEFIYEKAHEHGVESVWFLGDQFNNHALIHADVLGFWYHWLKKALLRTYLLVGNHDQAPSGNHAMMVFKEIQDVVIIDKPSYIHGAAVIPYIKNLGPELKDFFKVNGSRFLITHMTIDGAVYDNGFYAKDGIPLDNLDGFDHIISGHIHRKQSFGNDDTLVHYLGSPRWLNLSDANQEKFIHIVEWPYKADKKTPIEIIPISTSGICREISSLEITPETQLVLKDGVDYYFDLKGPKNWCDEQALKYSKLGKVRTFPTLDREIVVRESEGILHAFNKFKEGFKYTTDKDGVEKLLSERIYGQR